MIQRDLGDGTYAGYDEPASPPVPWWAPQAARSARILTANRRTDMTPEEAAYATGLDPISQPDGPDPDPERPLYPGVRVHLSTGHDGNIAAVMATVRNAMRRAGVPEYGLVMNGMWAEIFGARSYAEALNVVMRYVDVT